ncbi:MAG: hypothetical protein QOH71_705 [Blastocatellia bacterium]|nr:hypothetical protein [Blastocatellia bacterium]
MNLLKRSITASYFLKNWGVLRLALLIILSAVLGISFIASSSARPSDNDLKSASGFATGLSSNPYGGHVTAAIRDISPLFSSLSGPWSPTFAFMPQSAGPETINTFQQNCTTQQSSFSTGDTVCARADGNLVGQRRIYWVDPNNHVVQIDTVSSTNRTASRVAGQSGKWRVYLVDGSDGSARAVATFSVSDPQRPTVDLSVFKGSGDGTYTAGGFARYTVVVANNGPDTATAVQLSEETPTNTNFISVIQDSGPVFVCTPGSPTVCTIASMAANTSASFTFIYQVAAGTPVGTVIENTASVTSQTEELNPADNTTKIAGTVVGSSGGAGVCSIGCPDNITVQANTTNSSGDSGASVHFSPPSGNDECGVIVVDHCNDCFFPLGTTTVTATAATGDTCSFTVTVTPANAGAPTITCPANITTTADSNCQATVDPGQPTTTGDGVTVSGSRSDEQSLSAPYPSGTTTITWTATNSAGTASCQQTITVNDTTAPTITCPANVTQSTDAGACSATVDPGTATATDNCDTTPTVSSVRSDDQPLNAPYPKGTTTITWTAMDNSGNQSSCTQTVTVNDAEKPVITCPDSITAGNDAGECSATINPGTATASDNCGTATVTSQRSDGQALNAPYPKGTTTITWTATDDSGNSSSCAQTVTVNDTEKPVISCPASITANNDAGECSARVNPGTATATDNCGTATVTSHRSDGQALNAPYPNGTTTITWTATDDSGNSSSCTQTVTVSDTERPTITCPANISRNTDPGTCSATVSVMATATDNCSSPTVSGSRSDGQAVNAPYPQGTTTITWRATDTAGNYSECTSTVTVADHENPVISCPGNITVNEVPGTCAANVNPGTPTASDNCGSPTVTGSRGDGKPVSDPYPVGTTTITWTATDGSGNHSSCTQTITVVDNAPPTITFDSLTIFLNNLTIVFTTNSVTVNGTTYPFNGTSCTHEGYTFSFNGSTVTITYNGHSSSYTFNGNTLVLWTPTHQYQSVKVADLIASAHDDCDSSVNLSKVVITQVTSDEPDDVTGGGDGTTINDMVIAPGCKSVQLRAERNGNGNGRVYTITFKVRDASGNTTTATSKLKIFANSFNVVDDGPQNTVNGTCPLP